MNAGMRDRTVVLHDALNADTQCASTSGGRFGRIFVGRAARPLLMEGVCTVELRAVRVRPAAQGPT